MAEIALPVLAGNGVTSYLQGIKKFPVLEAKDEYMLAKRYQEYGDVDAAHKLVTSHLRLAAKVAVMYRNYGLPIADLISEANIGLMMAVKKFDPDKGFRLSTYAVWWIKAELHDFILRSWSLVRIGTVAAQKRLFYNLGKIKARLGLYDNAELDEVAVKKIAGALGTSEGEVREMNTRMAGDVSLNTPLKEDEGTAEKQDFLVDSAPSVEAVEIKRSELNYRREVFAKAMAELSVREREIIAARRLAEVPVTLEELAERYKISRERVRQIEARAFDKMCKLAAEAAAKADAV